MGCRLSRRRGFSILELLVAIIIIGVLVAILLPVVSQRAAQARIARANADLEHLAEGQARAAIDTGYYVRLFLLNDVRQGDGVAFNRGANNDRADGISDYLLPQLYYQNVDRLFIDPRTNDFVTAGRNALILNQITNAETNYNVPTAVWNGPYMNWRADSNLPAVAGSNAPDGIPDDPWGNNYLFFTSLGLVLEPGVTGADPIARASVGFDVNGNPVLGGAFSTVVFDRATVVSLGPDGLPGRNGVVGSTFGDPNSDDLFRSFGQ